MPLHLHNTLTRGKVRFEPLRRDAVGMYVCGPTVYDFAHIGNARPVVVFDVLYRLLKRLYPKVTYVRNITDVDDKINAAAKDSGESIRAITERKPKGFHEARDALGAPRPVVAPPPPRTGVRPARSRPRRAARAPPAPGSVLPGAVPGPRPPPDKRRRRCPKMAAARLSRSYTASHAASSCRYRSISGSSEVHPRKSSSDSAAEAE